MSGSNREDAHVRVQVHGLDSPESKEWDKFVERAESVHLEQLSSWGKVRRVEGWSPQIVIVRRNDDIVGGALFLVRQFRFLLKIGYVSRGPIVRRRSEASNEEEDAADVLAAIKLYAKRTRLSALVVDPPYRCGVVSKLLDQGDFLEHLPQLPPSGLMKGTLLIDLRADESVLLAGMRKSTRQDLRKAEQAGLRVREGGVADVGLLWRLLNELCRRRGVTCNVSSEEVLTAMWVHLGSQRKARIDVIESATGPLAALMTVRVGGWAIPWRIGWSGAEPKCSPEKALYWSVMRSVRQDGCSTFDFNWIDPREAVAIRAGGSQRASVADGVTNYKIGFGGEIIALAPPMDYFPNPVVRRVMCRFGGALLSNPAILRIVSSAHSLLMKKHKTKKPHP
jgi:peptidoglycan pentaglycine glycine transferase (the first glycine)